MFENQETPFFYANSVTVTASGYDVSVLFGRETPSNEGQIEAKRFAVHMSPMLAKRFNQVLTSMVERYEQSNGVIPSPANSPTL